MKFIGKILCVPLLLVSIASCKEDAKKTIKTQEVTFTKEGDLEILENSSDSLLVRLNIEIAESDYETQTGLMYRKGMEDNQGMLFIFPDEAMHSFYMKNTQFPLDLIFIKADSTIGSIQENAKPYDEQGLSSKVPVQFVLEVNAGLSEKWNLGIGDKVAIHRN
ncbi:DUF192 domain-containing protein [Maribacter aestuarii]|uniref:DUF192 domain-containing protein n=1 Tax=Maribacter aestuarii TaxID=1130723 RepID=UPI00248CA610|nr:DUF192 domain-containing protein [Maribacter aestuarii]